MFFGYPIAATEDNWLHECLVEMLTTIHTHLDANSPCPIWPDIVPAAYLDTLRRRTGLRDRVMAYREAAATLTQPERQRIAECLTQQNRIGDLCSRTTDCEVLDQLPAACRAPLRDLFDFGFSLLTVIGVRDRHYVTIYKAARHPVCPFCGCEYFDAPGAPREDLDHYLARNRYPLAGANLRNLVPMGMKCNERYKQAHDILHDDTGARRHAFDPYSDQNIAITLENSTPFDGDDGVTPRWQIDFAPDATECTTWDAVFQLRTRLVRDVLNPSFKSWLQGFQAWCKAWGVAAPDDGAVVSAVQQYAGYLSDLGYGDRAFLKAAVFKMIQQHCGGGNTRLLALMRDFVTAGAAE